jgi:arylsulfatase
MVAPRPSLAAGRTEFTYLRPLTGIPMGDAPQLLGTSYRIRAEVEVPQGGGEGMLVTQGGRFAGWGFYLLKGKPVYVACST